MAKKLDLVRSMKGKKPATPREAAPTGREHKTNVTGYYPPNVKAQLRILAAEKGQTIQRLLAEAINDLFAKYGKPEVAPLDA